MQLKSINIKAMPDSKRLWVKRWQQNGYYPINLYEQDETHGGYYLLSSKGRRTFYYDEQKFMFFLRNNYSLVSDVPMKNEKEFNFE